MDLANFVYNIWLVDDIEKLVQLKKIRNRIAHEYIGLGIYNTRAFIDEVLNYSKFLFKIIENVKTYSQKYMKG